VGYTVTGLTRTHRPNKSGAFAICYQASTHDYLADYRIRQGWNCYPPESADHALYIRKHSNRGCHSAWESISEAVTIRPSKCAFIFTPQSFRASFTGSKIWAIGSTAIPVTPSVHPLGPQSVQLSSTSSSACTHITTKSAGLSSPFASRCVS
jgi:hypothetical protein